MSSKNPIALSDSEVFWMLVGGVFLASAISLGAVARFATSTWREVVDWLVENHVLVSSVESPLIEIPLGEGTGLDLSRTVFLAGVVVITVAAAASALRRTWRRRRMERAA